MAHKRTAAFDPVTDSNDEDLIRFCQSYKRLKTATQAKDDTIATLSQTLEQTQAREKGTLAQLAASREDLRVAVAKHGNEIMQLDNARVEMLLDHKEEVSDLKSEIANAKGKAEQAIAKEVALQDQLLRIEKEHKELLTKFIQYKERVRALGNEV